MFFSDYIAELQALSQSSLFPLLPVPVTRAFTQTLTLLMFLLLYLLIPT